MKRWQHWILVLLLWAIFLAGAAGILFLWKSDVSDLPETTKEDRAAGEDKSVGEDRTAGEDRLAGGKGEFEGRGKGDGKEEDGVEGKGEGMWLFAGRIGGMEYFSGVVRSGKLIGGKRGFPSGKGERWEEQEGNLEPEPEISGEEEKEPPVVFIASDLHYQSPLTTDYGRAYQEFVAESDGKMVDYLPQLLDAFIDEMIEARPDAFLLTGDITMNGERVNHEELAGKLGRLLDAGVPVLVIPGNHDIHNYRARLYFGDEEEETESVSLDEFTELYQDFGWNQAISRDEGSFSYIYPLREKVWLMLLDTAQYDPLNIVDGVVRPGTLAWMEENLEKAKELGIQVIVSGHHNLLQESRLFTDMCVLENSDEVLSLLERYRLPLYISGHLHLQRIQKHRREPGDGGYGIDEIVSDALSIPPCQYGVLSWDEDEGISYETRRVGVSAWAKKTGQEDEALLDFEHYQKEYVQELIKAQIMEKASRLPESTAQEMAALYAKVYGDYCAGLKVRRRDIEGTKGYRSWQRYLPDSKEFKEIKSMVKDSMGENNFWESRGSE